jgi:hypothetical protein
MNPRILLFVAAVLSAFAPALAQEGTLDLGKYQVQFDEPVTDDFDGDGYAELTLYYKDGTLVASAEDTNLDGQPDLWFRYTEDWYADMEVHDNDFDGKPDEFLTMNENEEIVRVETIEKKEGILKRIGRPIGLAAVLVFLAFAYQKTRAVVSISPPRLTGVSSQGGLAYVEFSLRILAITLVFLLGELLVLLDYGTGLLLGVLKTTIQILKTERVEVSKQGRKRYLTKDALKERAKATQGFIAEELKKIDGKKVLADFRNPVAEFTSRLDGLKKAFDEKRVRS